MRLIAATLTALTVATFAQFTHAQDAPQHSAGMRVLDRFVGTWDVVYTHMPTGGETLTQKSWETRKWSMGGNFIHFVNPQEDNPGVPEFHMLLTYDPASSSYPGVFMSGTFRTLVTGTWDEEARSMTFRATFPDGSALVSAQVHRQRSCGIVGGDEESTGKSGSGAEVEAIPPQTVSVGQQCR